MACTNFINQIDLKEVIKVVGLKKVIRAVDLTELKEVIDEIGVDALFLQMNDKQKRELLRKLQRSTPSP